MQRDAVIVDFVRTPIGKYVGVLKDARPDDMAALVIQALLDRNPKVPRGQIEDVIWGATNQAGEDNRNVGRLASLMTDLGLNPAGVTVNRMCGSSMEAMLQASRAVKAGDGDIFIIGGGESMTRSPFVMPKAEQAFPRKAEIFDTALGWRMTNPVLAARHVPYTMGETGENVAQQFKINREEQDAFALRSHQLAAAAQKSGRFDREIVPVPVPAGRGETKLVSVDEGPRADTTLEQLTKLRPAFRKEGGTVTAGNASSLNDGAAGMIVMGSDTAAKLGIKPLARILRGAVAGLDPAIMGIGPVFAVRKLLERTGMKITDFDLYEINEAFASQVIYSYKELGMDLAKLNVNGGGISLGHPLGMTGCRLVGTMAYELQQRGGRYGLATMCIGMGMGIASIIERV